MNNDKNKAEKKRTIINIIKVIWLIYAIYSIINTKSGVDNLLKSGFDDESKITFLNENWEIVVNNKTYSDVSLEHFSFDTVTKKDTVEMKRILPNDWKYEEASLCFHTRHAAVKMYIDNEVIYEYGHDRIKENKAVGSGILFINFFEEYKGKELKIVLDVTETNAFSKLDEIWISECDDAYRYVITENRFPMFIGFFFVIFGILVTIIAIVTIYLSIKNTDVIFLAMFSIIMGLWTLCYYNCTIIFALPLYTISLLEHMCLFLAPIPFIGYMYKYVKKIDNVVYKKIYTILLLVQIGLTVFLIIFHTIDFRHATESLGYFHLLLVLHIIFFSRVAFLGMVKGKKSKNQCKQISIGIGIVTICVVYDAIAYIINRYFKYRMHSMPGIATMGFIILIVMFIIDLWYDITGNLMKEQEKKILLQKTYTDELTSISNRRFCSEYMEKIKKEKTKYSIVCFDLNGLKMVNDTYGHIKGDMFIKKAANIIDKAFGDAGIVGRMGGDEFISVLGTVNKDEIEKLVSKCNKLIDDNNRVENELKLSIAIGYATCEELEHSYDVEKVYHLADNRMYINKKEMKLIKNN